MANPADVFIALINETDENNPQSLIRFAKMNEALLAQLQGKMIGPYINYVREKQGKPKKERVEVGADDAVPFRIAFFMNYLNTLDKNEAETIAKKMSAIADNLYKTLSQGKNAIELFGGEHHSVDSLESALSGAMDFINQNKSEESLDNVIEYLQQKPKESDDFGLDLMIEEAKKEIEHAKIILEDYKKLMGSCIHSASAEQERLEQKIKPTKNKTIVAYHISQNAAASALNVYVNNLKEIQEEIESSVQNVKLQREQFPGTKQYYAALQAQNEKMQKILISSPVRAM